MEIVMLVVLVAIFAGGLIAMKRAGWFDGADDADVERARGSLPDQSAGPYHGM